MTRKEIENQIAEKRTELATLEEELKNLPVPLSEQTWLWGSDDGSYHISLNDKEIARGLTWEMCQMLILVPVVARRFKTFDEDPTHTQVKAMRKTLDMMANYSR